MPHTINGVQCRTKVESLQHIIIQAKKGKIGPKLEKGDKPNCNYQYPSGNNCAVGCLFSEAQLKLIMEENEYQETMNEEHIASLAKTFGAKNIEAVTGMKLHELETIQKAHDSELTSFGTPEERLEKAIEAVVSKAKTMLERAVVQV